MYLNVGFGNHLAIRHNLRYNLTWQVVCWITCQIHSINIVKLCVMFEIVQTHGEELCKRGNVF